MEFADVVIGGTIKQCYNSKDISVAIMKDRYGATGGIMGYAATNNPTIEECYNTGNITMEEIDGFVNCRSTGIVGSVSSGKITSCYNKGTIKMISQVATDNCPVSAGIVGQFHAGGEVIEKCYNTGNIILETDNSVAKEQRRASIVGYLSKPKENPTPNCYWLEGTSKKGVGEYTPDSKDTTIPIDSDSLKKLTEKELGDKFTVDETRN